MYRRAFFKAILLCSRVNLNPRLGARRIPGRNPFLGGSAPEREKFTVSLFGDEKVILVFKKIYTKAPLLSNRRIY